MGKGARYIVQTRYGTFSLDEGSYRDYLAGKSWINWPTSKPVEGQRIDTLPPEVSEKAVRLRDSAAKRGAWAVLQGFERKVSACAERLRGESVLELSLSVRASNGLLRAGVQTFGRLQELIDSPYGILGIRNLGEKSAEEIERAFLTECYARLLPYERAMFWQKVLDANETDG